MFSSPKIDTEDEEGISQRAQVQKRMELFVFQRSQRWGFFHQILTSVLFSFPLRLSLTQKAPFFPWTWCLFVGGYAICIFLHMCWTKSRTCWRWLSVSCPQQDSSQNYSFGLKVLIFLPISSEEEEGHNWIFSYDQMQDEGDGLCLSQHSSEIWNFLEVDWISRRTVVVCLCADGDELDWPFFQNTINTLVIQMGITT